MKKFFVSILTSFLLFFGGTAFASIPSPSGTIDGCYSALTGTLSVIDSNSTCGLLKTPLDWNQTGPQGPKGTTGPQGPQGAQGVPGPAGAPGG